MDISIMELLQIVNPVIINVLLALQVVQIVCLA